MFKNKQTKTTNKKLSTTTTTTKTSGFLHPVSAIGTTYNSREKEAMDLNEKKVRRNIWEKYIINSKTFFKLHKNHLKRMIKLPFHDFPHMSA